MYPAAFCTSTPPIAPIIPPIPTTLPTADLGNMSDVVVYRFADHPWCAAVARLTSPTTAHILWMYGAAITGTTASAHVSIAVFRAALIGHPRLISEDERYPPKTLPRLDALYTTIVGITISSSV